MKIQSKVSLLPYNTFGIDVQAESLIVLNEVKDLPLIFNEVGNQPFFLLGGGSNILFTQDFAGVLIKNELSGISVIKENEDHIFVEVGAGEVWHPFVLHCLEQGWYGLENLSLIPGTVGASPIQNIGAYGVEVKDCVESVEFYQISTGQFNVFAPSECNFGYRESIFKTTLKGDFVITKVVYKLSKIPKVDIKYGAIEEVLKDRGIDEPTPTDVSDAVIHIRQSKLPNPKELGNGGSFFKNPIIPIKQYQDLKTKFANIVSYPIDEHHVKVPAGWLIDQAGWKGKKLGKVGVHKNQALVLVNYGGGSGLEVQNLAKQVIASVDSIYGIELIPEINIV